MKFSLTVKPREVGEAQKLREQGLVPAVLYGPEIESVPVVVEKNIFEKVHEEAGSNFISLTVEGKKEEYAVLVQDYQFDPVTREITHIDFRQIPMNKEFQTEIDLNFIGEAPAVKSGGTLIKVLETLNITCLPKDLVGEINVDISKLDSYDKVIHVSDLELPTGIAADDAPNSVVVKVSAPLTDEQIKAMEETGPKSVEEIEVDKKKEAAETEEKEEAAK